MTAPSSLPSLRCVSNDALDIDAASPVVHRRGSNRIPSAKTIAFQESLGLQNDIDLFKAVKRSLRELMDLHFDYSIPWPQQPQDAYKLFETEVCETHPAFLREASREDSLRQLKFYVMTQFVSKHRLAKRKNDQSSTADVERNTPSTSSEPLTTPSPQKFTSITMSQPAANNRDPTPTPTFGSPPAAAPQCSQTEPTIDQPTAEWESRRIDSGPPATTLSESFLEKLKKAQVTSNEPDRCATTTALSCATDAPSSSHMVNGVHCVPEEVDQQPKTPCPLLKDRPQKFVVLVPPSKFSFRQGSSIASTPAPIRSFEGRYESNSQPPSSSRTVQTKCDPAVEKFLQNCLPPLLYLLPTFARIGLTDEACLKGVVAWPRADFINALEQWRCNGLFDPLQVEILRQAFDKYREDYSLVPFVNVQM